MKTNIFNSSLKNKIFDFINFKEAQGYKYTTEARRIKQFDKFLEAKTFNGKILISEIVNDYISFLSEFSTNTKCGRFSLVKEFSSYLRIFCPESYLIVKNVFRSLPRKKSYIFTDKEINLLLRTAKKYQSSYPLFSVCNYTIIGLLAFTGIRLQECLNLNIDDWDNRRSQLFIKKGKFGKDRIIPLLPSVNSKINDYINKRCKYTALGDTNPLFINRSNKRVRQNDLRLFFNKLLDTLQIKNKGFTGRKPVVHSLRHTFAVKNIIKWLNSGKNINNMLPYLSTYMGHISISSTQVYLQSVEEIKAIGSEKFYCFFRNNI